MTIHPVPKPSPREKPPRKPLTRSADSLTRSTPLKKVNRERLDRRTKEYKRYMASQAWALRRVVAIMGAEFRCQRCGWTPESGLAPIREVLACRELHVHHKTYARFGNERPEDLEVLCERCHMQHHATHGVRPRGLRGGR